VCRQGVATPIKADTVFLQVYADDTVHVYPADIFWRRE
jgi:hypothetical protein